MRALAFPCLLCAAASLAAQTPPCLSLNDANNNVGSATTPFDPSGPNSFAFRVTLLPTGFGYRSIEIFTGNTQFRPGFMTLELWGDDPLTNLPRSRISGGTWQISPALGNAWQGANLNWDIAPPLATAYWIVWTEPGLSTAPYEPGGTTLPVARLVAGSWMLQPAPQALKWRLFCAPRDGAHVSVYGSRCPTSSGYWGTQFTNQEPAVGNPDFAVEGTGFPSGQQAVLLLGTTPNFSRQLPGLPPSCMQLSDALVGLAGNTGTGDVRADAASTGAKGHVTFALPVPANPALVGLLVTTQVAVMDPGFTVPLPFATSSALQIVVF